LNIIENPSHMNSIKKILAYFLIATGVCFIGCKKEAPSVNRPPEVYAGPDYTVTLPTDSTQLNGGGSDPDGMVVAYKWRLVSGPSSVTIVNSSAVVTKVKGLIQGTYEFELTVTDNGGASASDDVVVVVRPPDVTGGGFTSYQSKQTGNWSSASSWQVYDGSIWRDARQPPSGEGVQVNILAGHTITVDSSVAITRVTIDSLGTLTILSDFTFDRDLTNNGTLTWQNGDIHLSGAYDLVTLTNNGLFLITGNDGTSSYWWDSDVSIVNNGVIKKSSGGLTALNAAHSVTNSSTGIIQGLGILSASGNIWWVPGFINNGTIAPGLPIGILAINDVLKPFSSGSVLQIEVLDNTGPGTGHDQLIFNNDITLAGKLIVTEVGSAVANGRFAIIKTTGTIKENFSSVTLPPGYLLQINGSSVEVAKQ
jgi:K319-like protein